MINDPQSLSTVIQQLSLSFDHRVSLMISCFEFFPKEEKKELVRLSLSLPSSSAAKFHHFVSFACLGCRLVSEVWH